MDMDIPEDYERLKVYVKKRKGINYILFIDYRSRGEARSAEE